MLYVPKNCYMDALRSIFRKFSHLLGTALFLCQLSLRICFLMFFLTFGSLCTDCGLHFCGILYCFRAQDSHEVCNAHCCRIDCVNNVRKAPEKEEASNRSCQRHGNLSKLLLIKEVILSLPLGGGGGMRPSRIFSCSSRCRSNLL